MRPPGPSVLRTKQKASEYYWLNTLKKALLVQVQETDSPLSLSKQALHSFFLLNAFLWLWDHWHLLGSQTSVSVSSPSPTQSHHSLVTAGELPSSFLTLLLMGTKRWYLQECSWGTCQEELRNLTFGSLWDMPARTSAGILFREHLVFSLNIYCNYSKVVFYDWCDFRFF